jgi:hypothetical protein
MLQFCRKPSVFTQNRRAIIDAPTPSTSLFDRRRRPATAPLANGVVERLRKRCAGISPAVHVYGDGVEKHCGSFDFR